MTWIKFTTWLCGLYLMYYIGMILWDLIRNRLPSSKNGGLELTFSEDTGVITTFPEYDVPGSDDPVISSGGVSLRQLFNLAREEAIEYIRPVGF